MLTIILVSLTFWPRTVLRARVARPSALSLGAIISIVGVRNLISTLVNASIGLLSRCISSLLVFLSSMRLVLVLPTFLVILLMARAGTLS